MRSADLCCLSAARDVGTGQGNHIILFELYWLLLVSVLERGKWSGGILAHSLGLKKPCTFRCRGFEGSTSSHQHATPDPWQRHVHGLGVTPACPWSPLLNHPYHHPCMHTVQTPMHLLFSMYSSIQSTSKP